MAYDLVVIAESSQHVTVNRASELLSTFSCIPWCIEVESSSDRERLADSRTMARMKTTLENSCRRRWKGRTMGISEKVGADHHAH